jgi:hypothetical protein
MGNVTTTSLYNGRIVIEFNDGNHRYKVRDNEKDFFDYRPGTTGILDTLNKPALKDWAAWMASEAFKGAVARHKAEGGNFNDLWLTTTAEQASAAHKTYSQRAKDVGHVVHSLIEEFLAVHDVMVEEIEGVDMERARLLLGKFVDWYNTSGLTSIGSEQVVYSAEEEYCGTFDCLFEDVQGRVILGDVKTTKRTYDAQKGVYPEYVAQLGAYAKAWQEETGRQVHDLIVLNPDKVYGEMIAARLSDYGITVQDAIDLFLCIKQVYDKMRPVAYRLKDQNELKKQAWFVFAKENKLP